MIICEKCVKLLGMDGIKGEKVGAIVTCPVCGSKSRINFNIKESDIIAFTLQVFRKSIEQSKRDISEQSKDYASQTLHDVENDESNVD